MLIWQTISIIYKLSILIGIAVVVKILVEVGIGIYHKIKNRRKYDK